MNVPDKSRWGTFVETTPLAIEHFIFRNHKRGILLSETSVSIRVIPEGYVTSSWYSKDFWQIREAHKRGLDRK